jgi:protoporphyrin/coproporphyrin ferrochelatase
MDKSRNTGVLLVAHGTVDQMDQMPAFLTEIRQGRPASERLIEEMTRRYEAIGGSPLLRITRAQASLLAEKLQMPVLFGMRFGTSKLSTALLGAAELKLERLVILPMAPFSVNLYANDANQAFTKLKAEGYPLGYELVPVGPWGTHEGLVRAQQQALLAAMGGQLSSEACIVVTAHSLPMRAIQAGDDYARKIEAFVAAFELVLGRKVVLAYQSQGQDSTEWLGPKLSDKLDELASRGAKKIVVLPIGFLCDHVETLYDLDHEARVHAENLGLSMLRVPALNDASSLIDVMANLVEQSLPS